jgi:cell wall-associated NlpC family hydrolase
MSARFSAMRIGARSLSAICLGAALAGRVCAGPASDDDPIGRYLQERGLLGGPTPAAAAPSPTRHERASEMVMTAMTFIDLPYRRGGTSAEAGFDCSGFTRHIFQTSLGLWLPRRVDEQASAPGLVKVAREQIEPGDLVFFNTLRTFSHVGIYIGEGRFIHAPRTGGTVRMESLNVGYWSKRFTGARRSEAASVAAPGTRWAPQAPLPAPSSTPSAPLAEVATH